MVLHDGLIKSRLFGENQSPEICNYLNKLYFCFSKNGGNVSFHTFTRPSYLVFGVSGIPGYNRDKMNG